MSARALSSLLASVAIVHLFALSPTTVAKPHANESASNESASNASMPDRSAQNRTALTRDFQTYIDANKILMFVTNKGSFAFDNGVMLGKADGLYYPYTGMANIENGSNRTTVIYAGSIWIGATDSASGDTLVTSGQHDTDWGVGPLVNGEPVPNADYDPQYRVYKLYVDSLDDNPNQDYLEWPVEDGAPVDGENHPEMIGDQMLWSVYNDLDVAAHSGSAGTDGRGLGIEIQQTVWAYAGEGGDIIFPAPTILPVEKLGTTGVSMSVEIIDPEALNGHDYVVTTDSVPIFGHIWRLEDVTTGQFILGAQPMGDPVPVTDGFRVSISDAPSGFTSFEVVANGAGPLDPPEAGAAAWAGFPVPTDLDPEGYPTEGQQVGPAKWLFHTGGDYSSYEMFLIRTFRRDQNRYARLGRYDWEMRFTGSNDNPGVGGSYAWEAFTGGASYWVPFELWRIGIDTPDDPSDDLRLIPWIFPDEVNSLYHLSAYGSEVAGNCGPGGCEHFVDDGDNDPYTDWVYWKVPGDETPGDAGYQVFEAAMIADPLSWPGDYEAAVMDRTVLVNWNGGEQPPFNQDLPEVGTVFRLVTKKTIERETFTFKADRPMPSAVGPEGVSLYAKFKMINKGGKTLNNFFASIWFDPDLGDASDDFVGCDTTANTFYCYNAGPMDTDYGSRPPAVGARVVEGPIVPSFGDTAFVDGYPTPNYKNLGMSSFNMYANPYGPDDYIDSYRFMNGLTKSGSPLLDHLGQPTKFFGSGDPVTGTGFLDRDPADRRMMANIGPFTFRPGDTQQVVIKISVGQGDNNLNSITYLKQILHYRPDVTEVADEQPSTLPSEFSVEQNYPNPFNPSTNISYSLPVRSEVELTIFNIVGQKVATLQQGLQSAGEHTVVWDGSNESGNAVASGIYFYRIKAGDNVQSRKMLLLK